jgi:hypothetical protein
MLGARKWKWFSFPAVYRAVIWNAFFCTVIHRWGLACYIFPEYAICVGSASKESGQLPTTHIVCFVLFMH